MIIANSFQPLLLSYEYLQHHAFDDLDLDWDSDRGDLRVLRDPDAGEETPFTGLTYYSYDGITLDGYEFYIDGTDQGQQVYFYRSGMLKEVMSACLGPDGTCFEFYESGALRKISVLCCGWEMATRAYTEQGDIIQEYLGPRSDWKSHLDYAARRGNNASWFTLILSFDYLKRHAFDGSRLNFDTRQNRYVLRNPTTGSEAPFTGLTFFAYDDVSLERYSLFVNGVPQGQEVSFHRNGVLKRIAMYGFGPDGTWFEFDQSGVLRNLTLYCCGQPMASREYDEQGNMTGEQLGITYPDWGSYLDHATGDR